MRERIQKHFDDLELWFSNWTIAQNKVREIRDKVLSELERKIIEEVPKEEIQESVPKSKEKTYIRGPYKKKPITQSKIEKEKQKKKDWYIKNKERILSKKREVYKNKSKIDPIWLAKTKATWHANWLKRKERIKSQKS